MEPYRQGKARRFSIKRRDVGKGVMIHQRVRICPALSYNHTVQLHWIFRILNIKQGEFQALVPGPASIAPPAAAGIGYSILSDSEKKILAYWMEIIRITADLKLSGYMRGRRVFQINNIERLVWPLAPHVPPREVTMRRYPSFSPMRNDFLSCSHPRCPGTTPEPL